MAQSPNGYPMFADSAVTKAYELALDEALSLLPDDSASVRPGEVPEEARIYASEVAKQTLYQVYMYDEWLAEQDTTQW